MGYRSATKMFAWFRRSFSGSGPRHPETQDDLGATRRSQFGRDMPVTLRFPCRQPIQFPGPFGDGSLQPDGNDRIADFA